MINTIKKMRNSSALLAVASALGITSASASAFATPATSTVQLVEASAGTVIIQLASGVNYYGTLNAASGCTANNTTADTLKAWTSLAQAALLSGKSVNVYFTLCSGVNYVSALDLKQ